MQKGNRKRDGRGTMAMFHEEEEEEEEEEVPWHMRTKSAANRPAADPTALLSDG